MISWLSFILLFFTFSSSFKYFFTHLLSFPCPSQAAELDSLRMQEKLDNLRSEKEKNLENLIEAE